MISKRYKLQAANLSGVTIAASGISMTYLDRFLVDSPEGGIKTKARSAIVNAAQILNGAYGDLGVEIVNLQNPLELEGTITVVTTGSPSGTVDIYLKPSGDGVGGAYPDDGRGILVKSIAVTASGTINQTFKLKG